jgi:hypothetical protein
MFVSAPAFSVGRLTEISYVGWQSADGEVSRRGDAPIEDIVRNGYEGTDRPGTRKPGSLLLHAEPHRAATPVPPRPQ